MLLLLLLWLLSILSRSSFLNIPMKKKSSSSTSIFLSKKSVVSFFLSFCLILRIFFLVVVEVFFLEVYHIHSIVVVIQLAIVGVNSGESFFKFLSSFLNAFFSTSLCFFFSVLYLTSTIQKNLVVLSLGLFCLCCCHNNCRIFFHQIAVVVVVLFTNRKTTFFFFKKISLPSFFFLDLR